MDLKLQESIKEALLLGKFKTFCENNSSIEAQQKIRTIYNYSSNPLKTTKNILINELGESITDEELPRLFDLISAFLKKSDYRKAIPDSVKSRLLLNQGCKCAICKTNIDHHAHADHIVPFKYVGDELADNLQLLCSDCNLKKNDNIDFQIRFLLKTL